MFKKIGEREMVEGTRGGASGCSNEGVGGRK